MNISWIQRSWRGGGGGVGVGGGGVGVGGWGGCGCGCGGVCVCVGGGGGGGGHWFHLVRPSVRLYYICICISIYNPQDPGRVYARMGLHLS